MQPSLEISVELSFCCNSVYVYGIVVELAGEVDLLIVEIMKVMFDNV